MNGERERPVVIIGCAVCALNPHEAPDYVYEPFEPETFFPWHERHELIEDMPPGGIRQYSTLIRGPEKWAAKLSDGVYWFDSESAAQRALLRDAARKRSINE